MSKLVSIVTAALMLAGFIPASIVQAAGGGGEQPYVEIFAPAEARTGGHDMQLAVTLHNPRNQQVWFDGYIVHDANLEYNRMVWSNGSDVYTTESEGNHQYKYWRGLISPNGSAGIAIQAKTPQQQDITFLRAGFFFTASGTFTSNGRSIIFTQDGPLPPVPIAIPNLREPQLPPDPPVAVFTVPTIGEAQWSGTQTNTKRGSSDAECIIVMSGDTPDGRTIITHFKTNCVTGFLDD